MDDRTAGMIGPDGLDGDLEDAFGRHDRETGCYRLIAASDVQKGTEIEDVAADGLLEDGAEACRALAENAGLGALADDTAAAAGADNGLEVMMAHQLGAAHALAMKLAGRASAAADMTGTTRFGLSAGNDDIARAARTAGQAARMMTAFQRGALALDRLRHGNRLTITVRRDPEFDGD